MPFYCRGLLRRFYVSILNSKFSILNSQFSILFHIFATMDSGFLDRISDFIATNNLLTPGAKVVAGVSGGADSTALLVILTRLGYHVHAVHCNFHLRGAESDRDQQFVTDLCAKLGVELEVCNYDTESYARQHGISIEMAARDLRYADFNRIMQEQGASAICIAHHRDDSVETVLLNLIRGTGLRGLTGIKPVNGSIIRPLLCVSRAEIEQWLSEMGQPYVTDSTNLETDYTRNKIRNQLLPLMRTVNPEVNNAISTTAQHLQQAYTVYNDALDKARAQVLNGSTISIPELKKLPSAQAFLFELLSPLGFNSAQINDISASFDAQTGTRFLSATHQVIKERDSFTVSPIAAVDSSVITVSLVPGTAVTLPDGRRLTVSTAPAGTPISRDPYVATFDAALITEPVTIRRWREGDRFVPFGMKGSKLVSDLLTDIKVSTSSREGQLVATAGDDIIWVLGLRSDNRYRVSSRTDTQLVITLS